MESVKPIDIKSGMKVKDLVSEMSSSGVMGAGRISKAVEIMSAMKDDKDCKVFFGLAGAMVPGGMKNIVIDMLKNGYIDVFVTTGANMTHDLIEALGFHHYQGSQHVNDKELHKKGIDRIYDTFMKNEVYEKLEEFFNEHFDELKDETDIKEFLWKIGGLLEKDSILKTCYDKKIPIFCPGIADSGIGLMIWGHLAKGEAVQLKAFEDLKEIMDISWTSKKSGVIYIGGGVPKNYIQQAMQVTNGASYGIQITTDRPESGGSSGAELKEGISWGKMNEEGNYVNVICDATIALPLIYAAVK
ncbi:MAG: deoxyhypusine synthase [Nanoarchaeota archaeon]|nr:deoxyhypusine synthase [Nanoarchaeota archaeon]MCG2717372.1 deoxyhypusine synthase [Nanoarchaeota archaeon]